MRVRLRYFAAVREAAGGREGEEIDLPAGTDVAAVRVLLAERHPALAHVLPRCAAAVNRAYVAPETTLRDGDELVFIPPVGGG